MIELRRLAPRLALAVLLIGAAAWTAVHWNEINTATIDAWVTSAGPWAPIAHIVLFAVGTVAFFPGVIFSLAGGVLFGPIWGSVWNVLGATLGATLAFLAARYMLADWVDRRAVGLAKRLIEGVNAEGWRFVALMRLVPLFPFSLSNYALGLTRIPLGQYLLASLVCMIPGTVAYTWLGHAGRGALIGEAREVRYGLLALGLLAAIALLPRIVRRLRQP